VIGGNCEASKGLEKYCLWLKIPIHRNPLILGVLAIDFAGISQVIADPSKSY